MLYSALFVWLSNPSAIHLVHRESGSVMFKSIVREQFFVMCTVGLIKECGLLVKSLKELTSISSLLIVYI